MVNLSSFFWSILLKSNKTINLKKSLLMKVLLFISCYFPKKLTCVLLGHKDLKKHFKFMRVSIKKFLWWVKKWKWHFIRNYFEYCLMPYSKNFLLMFFLWQWHHFHFNWPPLWLCYDARFVAKFFCSLRKKRFTLLYEETQIHIW